MIEVGYPIGYQKGSFLESYMVEVLGIPRPRLRALGLPEEYANALELGSENGGGAVVVDECPYIQLFLSTYCQSTIVGSKLAKIGWYFVSLFQTPVVVRFI